MTRSIAKFPEICSRRSRSSRRTRSWPREKPGAKRSSRLRRPCHLLISGSADLHGSTLNYINDGGDFTRDTPGGRNIHFGIREHGMCAIMNGVSYHGVFRASGATFLVFTDYCRPSIRLAALSKLPNIYIFTHDSIGVGEDGPTHEPVETVSSVRVMPQIDVIRPADPEETAGAFVAAAERIDGPTLLALTRQTVPILNEIDVSTRREGVRRGGYIAKKEKGKLEVILMSCGSELQHALAAAKELGDGVRVVSMPCFERFERESEKYREEVLPASCRKRVAIEAGVPDTWYRYVGLDGKVIGLHRFGLSAPGKEVMKEFGIDAEHVVKAAKSLLKVSFAQRERCAVASNLTWGEPPACRCIDSQPRRLRLAEITCLPARECAGRDLRNE